MQPNLVILDVKMPGKDGIQLAAEIVDEQIAPVIILTAYCDRDLIQRAIDAGAMTYLAKPFSTATLLPAIELTAARQGGDRRVPRGAHRGHPAPSDPQSHRPGQGPADDPGRDDRTAGLRWLKRTAMDRRTSMDAVARDVIEHPLASAS